MAFFQSKPNLAHDEKARLEFHMQQVVDCIGFERMVLPFISSAEMTALAMSSRSPTEVVRFVGEHLAHKTDGLSIQVQPQVLEKCGGGG